MWGFFYKEEVGKLDIRIYEKIPENVLEGVQIVHACVFEGDRLKPEKLNRPQLLMLVSFDKGRVTGFKFGYEHEDGVFYSWLGGVHPDDQGRGIARALMEKQHKICRQKGYTKVRTYSRNTKKAMIILNIKSGFDIISTFVDHKGRHKIVMEKDLIEKEALAEG